MVETASLTQVALTGLAGIALGGSITWLASVLRRDVSLVDRVWGLFIAGAALAYAWQVPSVGSRGLWMTGLVTAWGLRLSLFITWRNWGHGEDRRYQAIRARNQPHFPLKSLVLVFALQAVLAWTVSMPFLVAVATPTSLGLLDGLGICLAGGGLLVEALADAQMARFRADPAHQGRVMDRGLWRYSRHPNYFGETCVWWGLWLMAVSGAGWGGAWTVVSPLLMTFLLLKVSGVSLLEQDIGERRPGYRDYIARTNAFIPGWPREPGRP
jgi:steroid 5-alpha reductase family enzyme